MSAGRSRDAAQLQAQLAEALPRLTGQRCTVGNLKRLSGGAIQENWALDVQWAENPAGLPSALVLRTDAASAVATSAGRAEEFAVLETVWQAGVKAPRPVLLCDDATVIGAPFFLMERAAGVGLGNRVVKETALAGDRPALLADLAAQLARLHAIRPPQPQLAHLGEAPAAPAQAALDGYARDLAALSRPSPVIAWGLAWARAHRFYEAAPVFCHRDFRTGNYMVDAYGLTAVLDWEFAGWSDPDEDLGWFLSRSWRFSRPELEAGGIGSRGDFLHAYTQAAGRTPDPARVAWWEVVANIRWAIIALQQAERLAQPGETGLELALIGRRVPEIEAEILALTMPEGADSAGANPAPPPQATSLPQPDLAGLLRLAAGSLRQELMPELPAAAQYKALMLAAALDRAAREAAGGASAADADLRHLSEWAWTEAAAGNDLHGALHALQRELIGGLPASSARQREAWTLLQGVTQRARFAD